MQPAWQLHPVTTSPPSRNVLPSRALQGTGSNTPLRPLGQEERRQRNESPYPQVDARDERTVIRAHAEQGDRTASIPSSAKPSAPSPPLKRPSASTSSPTVTPHSILRPGASIPPLSSPPAPPQTPSRGATFELPHPPSADRGLARPRVDYQGRKDPSAASYRPSATLEYTPATTESPRQGHKDAFAAPHIAPVHPEHIPAATERPFRQDCNDPSAASRVPITGYVTDVTQYQKAPTEGSIQRADSSYRGHGYDSSASHLPDTGNSRKKFGQSLNTAPTLDGREAPITPPTALVSTQNQPKHLINETSISHTKTTTSSANDWSQPPSLSGDSRTTHLTSDKSFIFLSNLG
jgi:hypothetical protein